MQRNFKIKHGNELHAHGRGLDIKNCYRFEALKITPDFVSFSFAPSAEWAAGEPFVTIVYSGLSHLSFSDGFGTLPYLSDVSELGFTDPSLGEVEYLNDEPTSDADHMIIAFANGQQARVGAELATVHNSSARLRAAS